MVRVALLVLVVAALAILVLSNLSPVALTILGTKTLALPLGVWVAGAIGSGALTILVLSGLLRLGRPASPSARRPSPKRSDRVTTSSFRNPWSAATGQTAQATAPGYTGSRTADRQKTSRETSRETSQPASASWDDWSDYQELTDRKPQPQANIRDTEDDAWADWEGYEEPERNPRRRSAVEDDFENDFESDYEDSQRDDRPYTEPARTDFEVKREPETHYQSGSVYSFSYRRSDEEPEPTTPSAKPGEVYDADYRVITPPYHPDPEEVIPPPDRSPDREAEIRDSSFAQDQFDRNQFDRDDDKNTSDMDEDDEWGLDDWGSEDDSDDRTDRPRR